MNNNYPQNGFLNMGYMNTPYSQQQQMYPVQQKGITTVVVVSGEDSVNSYPVAAGNTAVLMDFNLGKFWLKTTDVYGRPLPVEEYGFYKSTSSSSQPPQSIKNPDTQQLNQNDYVRKEDFDKVATMVVKLYQELGVDKNARSE